MLHTTLKLCKVNKACTDGYRTLKKSLPKDHKKTDLIPLTHVIESNGLEDALWALRATVEDSDYLARAFAIWCARECLQYWEKEYPDDDRVKNCIDIAEQYNNGQANDDDLQAAEYTASSAAYSAAYFEADAVYAAYAAARSAMAAASFVYSAAHTAAYFASSAANSAVIKSQKDQFIKMLESHR